MATGRPRADQVNAIALYRSAYPASLLISKLYSLLLMVRIGLIGLGDIATKAYLPLLCARPEIDIHLCSRSAQHTQRLAAQYQGS
jgi:glutamyl-tRNA reductase